MASFAVAGPKNTNLIDAYRNLPLNFEANEGQASSEVKYLFRGGGYAIFLTPSEAILALQPREQATQGSAKESGTSNVGLLHIKLAGGNASPRLTPLDELPGKSNYFFGGDPKQWQTNIPNYARIEYKDMYPGIDMAYYGTQGQLEFDFVIAPGADPKSIQLELAGTDDIDVDAAGNLRVGTEGLQLTFRKPTVYQDIEGERKPIPGSYVLGSPGRIAFEIGSYDRSKPLVIDPVLLYSTQFGGQDLFVYSGTTSIAVDPAGNAYITGYTCATGFPLMNPLQATRTTACPVNSSSVLTGQLPWGEAFVAKINASGTALIYSTYLGGSQLPPAGNLGLTVGWSIAADSSGNAYVTGVTTNGSFPVTPDAIQSCAAGSGFVTKISPTGSDLSYSTCLAGSPTGIAVDSAGSASVTGITSSRSFPTTPGAVRLIASDTDNSFFVLRLNPAGSALTYSARIGGFSTLVGNATLSAIALDPGGSAYIASYTASTNFPTTPGVLQPTLHAGQGSDAVVFKLNSSGTALVYATYLGGSANDMAKSIAVDSSGNAYVTGQTASADFPVSQGAFQPFRDGPLSGGTQASIAFISKIDPSGAGLVFSTFLGGSLATVNGNAGGDFGIGIAVDSSGSVYVAGYDTSGTFPVTRTALPCSNLCNVFVSRLNSTGTGMMNSSYISGSSGTTFTGGMAMDRFGNAYVTAYGSAAGTAPITPLFSSGAEFIAKLDMSVPDSALMPSLVSLSSDAAIAGGPTLPVTLTGSNFLPGSDVRWNGVARPTIYVSGTQLQVDLGASDLATASTDQIRVMNPLPSGELSNALQFTVNNPVPVLNSISPSPILLTPPGLGRTLMVVGANFVSGSRVRLNGDERGTTFVDSTQLKMDSSFGDFSVAGTVQITVSTPGPGGGTSNSLTLAVNNPAATLNSFSPSSVRPGSGDFVLTVRGSFLSGATVLWNGEALNTTYVDSSDLTVAVSSSQLTTPQLVLLTVLNPSPVAGPSQSLKFPVTDPPTVAVGGFVNAASFATQSVAPRSLVSLFGANLSFDSMSATVLPLPKTLAGATVTVNGVLAPLIFVSPQQINFQMPWEFITPPTAATVIVTNNSVSSLARIFLNTVNPGIFSINQQGSGQGAVLINGTSILVAPIGTVPDARPAARGESIAIFCTGLGSLTTNGPNSGVAAPANPPAETSTRPTVTIGGVSAAVSFSGLAPGFVGLYQVNVQVPLNSPRGDSVPLVLGINGITSNTVTIAVE